MFALPTYTTVPPCFRRSLKVVSEANSALEAADRIKFSAAIRPEDNANAEKELSRQISKTDFKACVEILYIFEL